MERKELMYVPTETEKTYAYSPKIPARDWDRAYENSVWLAVENWDDPERANVLYLEGGTRGGCRLTIVTIVTHHVGWKKTRCGWCEGGFHLPVPEMGTNLPTGLSLRGLSPAPMPRICEVPGFDAGGHNTDGWYTKSLFAVPVLDGPRLALWGTENIFSLREGVYVYWDAPQDGDSRNYRLVPHREFWTLDDVSGRMERQGDFFAQPMGGHKFPYIAPDENHGTDNGTEEAEYDRHVVHHHAGSTKELEGVVYFHAPFMVTHPEHETLRIEGNDWWKVGFFPGTSRPFARTHNLD